MVGKTRYVYMIVVVVLVGMSAVSPIATPVTRAAFVPTVRPAVANTPSAPACPNATAAVQAMVDGPGWILNTAWTFNASGHFTHANGSTDDVTVRRSASYSVRLTEDSNIGDKSYYQFYSNSMEVPQGSGTIDDVGNYRYKYSQSNNFYTFDSTSKGSGESLPAVQRLEFNLDRCVYSVHTSYDVAAVKSRYGTNDPNVEHMLAGSVHVLDIPIPEPARATDKLVLGGFARVRAPLLRSEGTRFTMGDGPPSGDLHFIRTNTGGGDLGTADIAWEFSSQYEGRPPVLSLDKELLERSVFLDQVTVDNQFDANINWADPREGFVTWKLGNTIKRVGKTGNPRVSQNVNVGAQGVGRKTLTVQAQNTVGQPSRPETTQITVAPPPSCVGPPSTIQGLKLGGGDVNYKFNFKFPEPVGFKAMTEKELPKELPFFGGSKFGIEETQVAFGVDVRATGEGYATGAAKTGLTAMKSTVTGEATGRADLVLDPSGVHVKKGELEFKIAGKLKAKEPLVKLLTPMGPVVTAIQKVPGAQALVDKAAVQIELEPKIAFALKVKDDNGCLKWDSVEVKPAMGIKASVIVSIVPKKFEVTVSVGGEGTLYLGVPSPYYRGSEVKFMVGAKVFLYKFALEGETAFNARFGGQQKADALLDGTALPQQAGTWKLIDQSYLNAPDYNKWTGMEVTNTITNQQVLANVYPLAHPSFVKRPGASAEYLVWAHDKGGSNPQGSDELMYARGTATDWSEAPKQLTNDNVSDLNPVILPLADGNNMVIWERFDTPRPGDINADMDGYFGHLQIAAGTFWPTATTPQLTPLQLSTGGSLNHHPEAGVLGDGAMVVWVHNTGNKLMGDAANPDQLMWSRYSTRDGSWSAAAPLAANIAGMRDLKLATAGDRAALVWSQDTDGNAATVDDQELFYAAWQNNAWSAPTRLTANAVVDGEPLLQLNDKGAPTLIWQQGSAQRIIADRWDAAPRVLPFQLDEGQTHRDLQRGEDGSMALTWQELEGNDVVVGYAIYDNEAKNWGAVATVRPPASTHEATGTTALVSNVSPVLVTGESGSSDALAFAYQLASVRAITKTIDGVAVPNVPQIGAQQLHIAHIPLGANLHVTPQDLSATPLEAKAGTPTTISARINNTGGRSIPGGTAELLSRPTGYNSGGTVVATKQFGTMGAGTAITTTFTVPRPATAEQTFFVRVTPDNSVSETIFGDNEARLGTELAGTALASEVLPGGVLAQVRVERNGLPYSSPITASLRLDAPDGPLIGSANIQFPADGTDVVTATTWIPKAMIGEGRHLIFWDIDPNQRLGERTRGDNEVVTAVRVAPDLATQPMMVAWDQTPGTSKSIRMIVRNDGNAPAKASVVTVWTGEPVQSGSRELGRLAIPTIGAGELVEVTGTLNLTGLPAATTGLTSVYVQLDATNVLAEINENNNLVVVGGNLGGSVNEPIEEIKVYLPMVRR